MTELRSRLVVALAAAWVVGCGAGERDRETGGGPRAADAAFTIEGRDYRFYVVTCDLSGASPTGLLLRGTGAAPDGRRLFVELERLRPGEVVWERATVTLGDYAAGDRWEAGMGQWPDGSWYGDEAGQARVEGPLIRISGTGIAVDADFRRPRGDTVQAGALRATCGRAVAE